MPYYSVQTGDTATAAANTEVVLTIAASSVVRHVLKAVDITYSAAPTNGLLTIEEGSGNVVRSFTIGTQTSFSKEFPSDGLILDRNVALVVRLSAGGSGVIGRINVTRSAG